MVKRRPGRIRCRQAGVRQRCATPSDVRREECSACLTNLLFPAFLKCADILRFHSSAKDPFAKNPFEDSIRRTESDFANPVWKRDSRPSQWAYWKPPPLRTEV